MTIWNYHFIFALCFLFHPVTPFINSGPWGSTNPLCWNMLMAFSPLGLLKLHEFSPREFVMWNNWQIRKERGFEWLQKPLFNSLKVRTWKDWCIIGTSLIIPVGSRVPTKLSFMLAPRGSRAESGAAPSPQPYCPDFPVRVIQGPSQAECCWLLGARGLWLTSQMPRCPEVLAPSTKGCNLSLWIL